MMFALTLYRAVSFFVHDMRRALSFVSLLGLSLALQGCASVAQQIIKEPKIAFSNIGIQDIGVNGATVMVGVRVENPNAFALTLDALIYDLEIGGKALSSGKIPDALSVAGGATKIIEIPVPVKFQDLFSSVFDFMQKTSSNYRVKGEARFGFLTIPFDKTGDLKLK